MNRNSLISNFRTDKRAYKVNKAVGRPHLKDYLRKHWLLVGILVCIFLAVLYPELGSRQGPLYTDVTVQYGAVTLIFLISGISLKTDNILPTIRNYRLHLFIQGFTFILAPIFAHVISKILEQVFNINEFILKGLVVVACMPPPVSSAVILTRVANGNETAAIFNSVLGSFLGIILTPILIYFNFGSSTIVPLLSTVVQLMTTVLIPLILGQTLRIVSRLKEHNFPLLSTVGQCALLFVIYTTFCDTFVTPEHGMTAAEVLQAIASVLVMQILLFATSFFLCGVLFKRFFNMQDLVAVLFCSTHKSLTLGIPILRIMYHGFSYMNIITLPLLVYHPTQIILGGWFASEFKIHVQNQKEWRAPI